MYQISILPSARKDILNAAKWYDEQSEGLGGRFKEIVIEHVNHFQDDFIIRLETFKGLSSIFIKGFPYKVYFKKDEGESSIVIYAVLHHKQSRTILDKRK